MGPDNLATKTKLVEHAWTASNAEFLLPTTIALLTAENSIASLIASLNYELWCAEYMDYPAAVVGCDPNGYVWAWHAHPNFQSKGVGRTLMGVVKYYLKEQNLPFPHPDLIDRNTLPRSSMALKGISKRALPHRGPSRPHSHRNSIGLPIVI